MKCPQCRSSNLRKDGYQNGKQRFECKDCGRLFRESYEVTGYRSQVKKLCLEMYLNGMGFLAIAHSYRNSSLRLLSTGSKSQQKGCQKMKQTIRL